MLKAIRRDAKHLLSGQVPDGDKSKFLSSRRPPVMTLYKCSQQEKKLVARVAERLRSVTKAEVNFKGGSCGGFWCVSTDRFEV